MSSYERMMRNASQILFWVAVLLFIGGVAMPLLMAGNPVTAYGGSSGITLRDLVVAIDQGLNSAVWPFFGAGLIWTLQAQRKSAE